MKRYIRASENIRQNEYNTYLASHIQGVNDVWNQMLRPAVTEHLDELNEEFGITDEDIAECDNTIMYHDASKYGDEEYDAYCNHWYPTEKTPADEDAYEIAWIHHKRVNSHHWQHWLSVHDSGSVVPVDMPASDVFEMLCDWHSFSRRDPSSTAPGWYKKQKSKMILSSNTKKLVKALLPFLKEPLK